MGFHGVGFRTNGCDLYVGWTLSCPTPWLLATESMWTHPGSLWHEITANQYLDKTCPVSIRFNRGEGRETGEGVRKEEIRRERTGEGRNNEERMRGRENVHSAWLGLEKPNYCYTVERSRQPAMQLIE